MELAHYVDLYLSESHDHLRLLNRALLDLEQNQGSSAVEEAFRSAHTIKGMSATMGFAGVSDIAHDLESVLDQVRAQRRAIDRTLIDELLTGADLLERAVNAAASGAPVPARPAAAAGGDATGAIPAARPPQTQLPDDGGRRVRVTINEQEPMKIARALIITRDLVQKGLALPAGAQEFDADFDGTFALALAPETDTGALTARLSALPEVASYAIEGAGSAAAPETPSLAQPGASRPTSYLRVDQRRMDEAVEGLGELAILHGRADQLAGGQGQMRLIVDRMARVIADLQHTVLSMRMVPVGHVFDRFPRLVRDAARTLEKEVDFEVDGRDIELDRAILEEVVDPLMHLLRNAVDHGIEPTDERLAAGKPARARIVLRALRDRSSVRIQVEDDGRGVGVAKVLEIARQRGIAVPETENVANEDLLRILAHSGFSTARQVTGVSGRGVGLDAVVTRVRGLGGAIELQTRAGQGTVFTLRLPMSLAIAQALRVQVGDEDYAIPLTHVAEALELDTTKVERRAGREVVLVRGEPLPLIRLRTVLQTAGAGDEAAAVVAELGERRTALAVDRLVGREQILVKHFDSAVGTLPIFSGVTLLADGRPALVLDPVSVV